MTRLILWTYSLLACVCWPGRDSSDIVRRNIRIASRIQAIELWSLAVVTWVWSSRHPRRTEASSINTQKLFCRSAAVLGRPHRKEPLTCSSASVCDLTKSVRVFCQDGSVRQGRPRTAALRKKSFCVFMDGPSVRWAFDEARG